MKSEKLIQEAIEKTILIISRVESFKTYTPSHLMRREAANSWNTLECLEHLNLYGDFYLPQIEEAIKNSPAQSQDEFKSGWLGNYFAKSMLPKPRMKKIKTFRDKNPVYANLSIAVVDRFIEQQTTFIDLLTKSQKVSLNKVKIKTSISNLISLKLGDTFNFLINHNLRHLQQIENIEKATSEAAQF